MINKQSQAYSILKTRDYNLAIDAVKSEFIINSSTLLNINKFNFLYKKLYIHNMSIHYFNITNGFKINTENIRDYFTYIHVISGNICIQNKFLCFNCEPNKQSAILDYSQPYFLSQYDNVKFVAIKFSRKYIESLLSTFLASEIRLPLSFKTQIELITQETIRYNGIINRFMSLLRNDTTIYNQYQLINSYENLILTATLTCLHHNNSSNFTSIRPVIPKVVKISEEYIQDNFKDNIKIQDLVKITGIGIRSIQIAFSKCRGYSPQFYLMECRLKHAYHLLSIAKPNTSILFIALECGFSSQSFFSHCFRRRFGKTPIEILKTQCLAEHAD